MAKQLVTSYSINGTDETGVPVRVDGKETVSVQETGTSSGSMTQGRWLRLPSGEVRLYETRALEPAEWVETTS